jgi:cation diffusion facilitator CzcD-associated flavoprotein CzcO
VVCGAFAAGLAAAATLRRARWQVLVAARSGAVAASWQVRYDELRLNTPGWMAAQPGLRAPRRRHGEFPSRDQRIEYLEAYAGHHQLDIRFGTHVLRIDHASGRGWRTGGRHHSSRRDRGGRHRP